MSVTLDFAAAEHIPVRSHPTTLRVRVPLRWPTADGLRSNDEFPAMSDVEDLLAERLAEAVDAIYWGRWLGGGMTDFYYAVPDAPDVELLRDLEPALALTDYTAEPTLIPDPDWTEYQLSYPGSYHQQTMSNRHLQAHLREQGDTLTKRRVIDHVAAFPSAEQAAAGRRALKRLRFSCDRTQDPDDDGRHLVEFHRKDSCDDGAPDRITNQILDAIEPFAGEYGGWGCIVRR